ncbi:Cytochrome c oxidase subunit 8 [Komagataella phaffii CBS 7435]|uniref:Cytochrome c oxidase subunit 8, mitochondrial n=2 Tax=Komagataella phaffii TaxID=460519 RepID=C4R2C3_KOMPG|nr:Subunit VIII of cytochrome c oxidase [Komagataella phaffii GS115]KAI0462102.1 hypothetical protein LJB42_004189 [Komagataella kurtzmanii]CAH2447801.1 Cytochrome c oxidase subunit 8 [Komagataella phaffii CBS 7435]CAY69647.1 Subunit VIII of cytochrome c oxidase [Komagataella phaffii GS115]CCA37972.1 Cytochrome c oxidase subunit 8 [Komagataella phaffii CBS 7435]
MFRLAARQTPKRMFSTSRVAASGAHGDVGPYSNLPFKVKNRRVPYAVPHFLFFAIGMGIPFFACYVQLKRSGSI